MRADAAGIRSGGDPGQLSGADGNGYPQHHHPDPLRLPGWITELAPDHWLRESVFGAIRAAASELVTVRDARGLCEHISCPQITDAKVRDIDLGCGSVTVGVRLEPGLFYQILGEATGLDIGSESDLLPVLLELSRVKKAYGKLESALAEVEATGYGIVMPDITELSLEEPKIIRQGGKYGVRLKASAPSLHLMRADINTTISPIVGSEAQSKELVDYLLQEFEENPTKLWESNIFGKSLHDLMNEGLQNKLYKMPVEARMKLQEALERVINEGCNGLICFIL